MQVWNLFRISNPEQIPLLHDMETFTALRIPLPIFSLEQICMSITYL